MRIRRPPRGRGCAACNVAVFVSGAAISVRTSRQSVGEPCAVRRRGAIQSAAQPTDTFVSAATALCSSPRPSDAAIELLVVRNGSTRAERREPSTGSAIPMSIAPTRNTAHIDRWPNIVISYEVTGAGMPPFPDCPYPDGYSLPTPCVRVRKAYSPALAVIKSVERSFPPKQIFPVQDSATGICAICLPVLSKIVTPLPVR